MSDDLTQGIEALRASDDEAAGEVRGAIGNLKRWVHVVLAAVVGISLGALGTAFYAVNQIGDEARNRSGEICAGQNEVRAGVLAFVEDITNMSDTDRARAVVSTARENFAPLDCP